MVMTIQPLKTLTLTGRVKFQVGILAHKFSLIYPFILFPKGPVSFKDGRRVGPAFIQINNGLLFSFPLLKTKHIIR